VHFISCDVEEKHKTEVTMQIC